MTPSQFLPEQLALLAEVVDDPAAQLSAVSGLPLEVLRGFVRLCQGFIRASNKKTAAVPYTLVLQHDATGSVVLTVAKVRSEASAGRPVLRVDLSLRFVGGEAGGIRVTDACARTSPAKGIEVVVHGTYVTYVAGGRAVCEHDIVLPTKSPPLGIVYYKPISDFAGLFIDHCEEDVAKERTFRYWADRKARVLLATPETTEKIFQRALLNWLNIYVTDKLRVVAEPRDFGQDATDVLVITAAGDHVVEIKWLGKNESGTEYKQERINVGLRQVADYLERDQKILCAHLVVYDARDHDTHLKCSAHDASCRHVLCSEPLVRFLESDTPSQKAKMKGPPKKTA